MLIAVDMYFTNCLKRPLAFLKSIVLLHYQPLKWKHFNYFFFLLMTTSSPFSDAALPVISVTNLSRPCPNVCNSTLRSSVKCAFVGGALEGCKGPKLLRAEPVHFCTHHVPHHFCLGSGGERWPRALETHVHPLDHFIMKALLLN